ncbi:hypothetical protein NP233_g1985 [Leucocoprinus birnbaumii]|uniref:RING-type domain-containing protein n=1 Tax=Leucocoprinus birnbaumii TaxID=56174 RepID=A0AAD5W324_9AGAR|nr:hypothetical protein NP233_g1985 [Leucocoprinus birnbaumii]
MDPFVFTTEEEGILAAERALDELRVLLHTTSGEGRNIPGSSNSVPSIAQALRGLDQDFALREQLNDLDEMLRMITDSRLARTLIEDENERAAVGVGEDGENVDLLGIIVMTAREVMASQTYDDFDPSSYDQGPDGEAPRYAGEPVVVNRTEIEIPRLARHEDRDRELPPSPLSQFSDLVEPETEPTQVLPQIPTCVVCFGELSPVGRVEVPCGHYYCPGCARSLVDTYVAQPFPAGPLRCCPAPNPPISPRHVLRFLDNNKREQLEEKLVEAETPYDQRIYCPQDTCRKFIDPARVTPSARAAGSVICPNGRFSPCPTMAYNVTLTFRGGKSLTKKTDLILTFDKHTMEGMYDRYHPIAWKVTSFPKGGGGTFKATFTSDLAFSRAQVDGNILESAGYSTHIAPEQETSLTIDDPSPPATYKFTVETGALAECGTGSVPVPQQDWGLSGYWRWQVDESFDSLSVKPMNNFSGFFPKNHQDPTAVIVLTKVPGNTAAIAEFTPVLSAYVATGYQESQIIKAQIQSGLDWGKDLSRPMPLNWRLEESGAGFTLVEDSTE